ncbi:MAG: type II toxin-antitoxin system VapB family antitoxin [Candidatus Cloacimonetes bacterium]|nr:type II toxin-antitoxin system VapB family antitoxin [Candidatus Cloacimonadota bacterium]
MRTNVVIDDKLMAAAQEAGGYKTKKETIAKALELLIRINAQADIRKYRGKLIWDGDLDEIRSQS